MVRRFALSLWVLPPVVASTEDAQAACKKGDCKAALQSFRLLAEEGNVYAQYYLGAKYDRGQGVSRDYVEAAKWYRLAANQGFAQAQSDLGDLYKSGRGLPQDFTEAAKWYRLAADQGDAYAQYLLGFMYKDGYGVPLDYAQAYQWVNLADASGYPVAEGLRDVLLKQMTPDQITIAQRLVQKWLVAHPNSSVGR